MRDRQKPRMDQTIVAPVQPSSAPINQSQAEDQRRTIGSSFARKSPAAQSNDLLYGLLKETGRQRYVSPEGLQYNPGSEEGHRLKHLERHLKDQPDDLASMVSLRAICRKS